MYHVTFTCVPLNVSTRGWVQTENRCSNRCVNQACNDRGGQCSMGCKPGFFGDGCGAVCSDYCLNGHCNENDGSCNHGCKAGYHGPKCRQTCSQYCGNIQCNDQTGTCEPCFTYHGDICHEGCFNLNCTACQQSTGRCKVCEEGWYGDYCSLKCAEGCLNNSCNIDGRCRCNDGYYSAACDQKCPENCYQGICQIEGFCKNCTPGSKCNKNCEDDERSLQSGVCTRGCRKGYHGAFCNLTCNGGCAEEQCDQATAMCLDGCKPTAYGKYCEHTYSATCPRHMCHNVNGEQDDVKCSLDCTDGRWGSMCEHTCSPICQSCNRSTGACEKCKSGLYGSSCSLNCRLGFMSGYSTEEMSMYLMILHIRTAVLKGGL